MTRKTTSYLVHTNPRQIIRTPMNPPGRLAADIGGESMTRQEFKDECDINNIMKKYVRTGLLAHLNKSEPMFGEVPGHDFREALELVARAEDEFSQLPGEVRKRFENNPEKYLEFFEDPENREEAVALGLIEAPTPTEPPFTPEPEANPAPEAD